MTNQLKVESCEDVGDVQVVVFSPLNAGESDNGIRVANKVIAFLPRDIYDFTNEIGNTINKEEFEEDQDIGLFYQSHDSMFGSSGETAHYFFGDKEPLNKCLDYVVSRLKSNPDNVLGQIEDNGANVSLFYYDLGDKALLVHCGENGYVEGNDFFDESDDDDSGDFADYDVHKIPSEVMVAFAGAQYNDTSLFELIDAYALLELNASEKYFDLDITKAMLKKDFEYEEFLRDKDDFKKLGAMLKNIVHNLINYKDNLDFKNTVNLSEDSKKYFSYLNEIYK